MNDYKSVTLGPFSYLRPSVRTESGIITFLLLAQTAMLFITKSFDSLLIILASLLASYAVDFLNTQKNYKNSFIILSSTIRGLLTGLLIPASFPSVTVFFITFMVLFINRYALGGFANSWINPVALTVAVCWIIGGRFFPVLELPYTAFSSKNIALTLIQNGTFPQNAFDVTVTNFLNRKLFSLFSVSIPEGYFSLLWDSHSTIPAFRFNLLTIVSSILLLGIDVLNPIIPAVFIFTYALLVKLFAPFFYDGLLFHGDIILSLLSSGTLFSTFFLLSWHGTTPFTNRGKWVYALSAGILAFFIMGIGLSPCGFSFIILIVNVLSLFIQSFENRSLKDFMNTELLQQAKAVREGNDA